MTVGELLDMFEEKVRLGEISRLDNILVESESGYLANCVDLRKLNSCNAVITIDEELDCE
ncbi:hypothetical protein [Geobacter anodireducens]|uniref:Uncharacterized protein n=1 Tax=Geobacter anodireducens TaxID=1340425 RepID=A0ABR9NXI1_9BACT|nr:hypothetical protein [Geobacter anodireducens]MBE2888971.1 hypothetical protein [Geobacter anodireducens]